MRPVVLLIILCLSGCNLFGASPIAPGGTATGPDGMNDAGESDQSNAASDMRTWADASPDASTDVRDLGGGDDLRETSDSGTPDVGMDAATDASTDMPDTPPDMSAPDPCTWPDTLFCSGFEDPLLTEWEPFFTMNVAHETSVVRTGNGAGRFESTMNEGVIIGDLGAGVAPGATAWLRMFLYVPSSAPAGSGGGIVLGSFMSEGALFAELVDDRAVANSFLEMNDSSVDVPFVIPRDQWVCLEAMVTLSAAGEHLLAVDGTTLINESNVPLAVSNPLNIVGVAAGVPSGTGTLFVDDVFVGGSRPGCN